MKATTPTTPRGPITGNLTVSWSIARLSSAVRVAACVLALATPSQAQQPVSPPPTDPEGAGQFAYHRNVRVPGPGVPAVVVCEFFTHGALEPGAKNLDVVDGHRRPVPWRVLQAGPGDFCRIAFQTDPSQSAYRVEYGGDKSPSPPAWTADAGLVMETRRYRSSDLGQLATVRAAFDSAEPIGSVYIPNVFLRFNPAAPGPDPFFSVVKGTLRVPAKGDYLFFTSSQDCSFLLIDGSEVVAAPGMHGPVGQARIKGRVSLTAGRHAFEYVHAATGPDACLVAAWQPPGVDKPEPIPPAAFGSDGVAVLPASGPYHLGSRPIHDFSVEAAGEVPLSEGDRPLIRARFRATTAQGRAHWDFGDGQTGTGPAPTHVYLHPGLYAVKLSMSGEAASVAVTNRVMIDRPAVFVDKEHPADELADYLPLVGSYEAASLDPEGVVQLVRAWLDARQNAEAAEVGRTALVAGKVGAEAAALDSLARTVGPLLRDTLNDPAGALEAWIGAARAAGKDAEKAAYETEAADVALNDLLQPDVAKPMLDAASAHLRGRDADHPEREARLFRVWGDWYARKGDRASARAAYVRAAPLAAGAKRPTAEQTSWRGALSRSAEAFLRDKQPDRALAELRRWQDEYPADKLDGYLTLLQARERAARGKPAAAIVLAGDLVAVNPESPYADRLALLAAESHEKLGHPDRALNAFRSFLTDYPGSPLVAEARKNLNRLDARAGGAGRATAGEPK